MNSDFIAAKIGILVIMLNMTNPIIGQKLGLLRSEEVKIKKTDSVLFAKTWASFAEKLQTRDFEKIKAMSLPRLYCFNFARIMAGYPNKESYIGVDSFLNVASANKQLTSVIRDSAYRISAIYYPDWRIANYKLKHGEKLVLYNIYYIENVPVDDRIRSQDYHVFQFLKINDRFVFFGLSLEWP